MLPKAHLTSHTRMSGPRWVITLSWLSGSWKSFLYSYSMYSCHIFLISFASVRSVSLLSIIVPIFAWYVPFISLIFLERSLVFPFYCFPLFVCIDHLRRLYYCSLLLFGTLHSDGYTDYSPLPFTSLLFSAICKSRQQFSFCISSPWGWFGSLPPVECYESPSIALQAFCLSYQIPWIYLSLPLYSCKGSDLGHSCGFPYFFSI